MEVILIILAIYIIGSFFEKSDYDRMKEAENLLPFTKEEAKRYYCTELKPKHIEQNKLMLINTQYKKWKE